MSSSISPFTVKPLVRSLPVRVTSMAVWGDRLMVGAQDGSLRVYRCHTKENAQSLELKGASGREKRERDELSREKSGRFGFFSSSRNIAQAKGEDGTNPNSRKEEMGTENYAYVLEEKIPHFASNVREGGDRRADVDDESATISISRASAPIQHLTAVGARGWTWEEDAPARSAAPTLVENAVLKASGIKQHSVVISIACQESILCVSDLPPALLDESENERHDGEKRRWHLKQDLMRTKGALAFAVNSAARLLCVVTKRKLMIYEWQTRSRTQGFDQFFSDSKRSGNVVNKRSTSSGKLVLLKVITTPETGRCVRWSDASHYEWVNVKSGLSTVIGEGEKIERIRWDPGRRERPLGVFSPSIGYEKESAGRRNAATYGELLLACETQGRTINVTEGAREVNALAQRIKGKATSGSPAALSSSPPSPGAAKRKITGKDKYGQGRGGELSWSDVPTSIAFAYPFVIAVLPKKIEVHNVRSMQFAQTLNVEGGPAGASSVAFGYDHAHFTLTPSPPLHTYAKSIAPPTQQKKTGLVQQRRSLGRQSAASRLLMEDHARMSAAMLWWTDLASQHSYSNGDMNTACSALPPQALRCFLSVPAQSDGSSRTDILQLKASPVQGQVRTLMTLHRCADALSLCCLCMRAAEARKGVVIAGQETNPSPTVRLGMLFDEKEVRGRERSGFNNRGLNQRLENKYEPLSEILLRDIGLWMHQLRQFQRDLHAQFGYQLFAVGHYKRSAQHFKISDDLALTISQTRGYFHLEDSQKRYQGSTSASRQSSSLVDVDPRRVIALFPSLLPRGIDLSEYLTLDVIESMQAAAGGEVNMQLDVDAMGRVNSKGGEINGEQLRGSISATGKIELKGINRSAITHLLIPYLLGVRELLHKRERGYGGLSKHGNLRGDVESDNSSDEDNFGFDDFQHGNQTQRSVIMIKRIPTGISNGSNGVDEILTSPPISLGELVDTVLLKAFIYTDADRNEVRSFLLAQGIDGTKKWQKQRSHEHLKTSGLLYPCRSVLEDSEMLLLSIPEKWEELLWLYYSKGLHDKALTWLRNTTQRMSLASESSMHDIGSPIGSPSSRNILGGQNTTGIKSASTLINHTVAYLQRLVWHEAHDELVRSASEWISRYSPDQALSIFTVPLRRIQLATETVIEHYRANNKNIGAGSALPCRRKGNDRNTTDSLESAMKKIVIREREAYLEKEQRRKSINTSSREKDKRNTGERDGAKYFNPQQNLVLEKNTFDTDDWLGAIDYSSYFLERKDDEEGERGDNMNGEVCGINLQRILSHMSRCDKLTSSASAIENTVANTSYSKRNMLASNRDDSAGQDHSLSIGFLETIVQLSRSAFKYEQIERTLRQMLRKTSNQSMSLSERSQTKPLASNGSPSGNAQSLSLQCLSVMKQVRDASLHDKLATCYLQAYQQAGSRLKSISGSGSTPTKLSLSSSPHDTYSEDENSRAAVSMRRQVLRSARDECAHIRVCMLAFLQRSPYYSPQTLLPLFSATTLYAEQAQLLDRAGRYDDAMQLYVEKIDDPNAAEKYCDSIYQRAFSDEEGEEGENSERVSSMSMSADAAQNVYLSLLRAYLRPVVNAKRSLHGKASMGMGKGSMSIKPALKLLSRHAGRINPVGAMRSLPADTPIKELCSYFEDVTRGYCNERRKVQVQLSLVKLECLQVRRELLAKQKCGVLVDEHRICGVCRRPIALSAFATYPNNEVVHFACVKSKSQCPVTGTHF